VRRMKEDRPQEVQRFFDKIKLLVTEYIPDTLSGYLMLVLVNGLWLKTNSLQFLASIAETGIYMFCLGLCYYLGRASRFLVICLISRLTSDKRVKEALDDLS